MLILSAAASKILILIHFNGRKEGCGGSGSRPSGLRHPCGPSLRPLPPCTSCPGHRHIQSRKIPEAGPVSLGAAAVRGLRGSTSASSITEPPRPGETGRRGPAGVTTRVLRCWVGTPTPPATLSVPGSHALASEWEPLPGRPPHRSAATACALFPSLRVPLGSRAVGLGQKPSSWPFAFQGFSLDYQTLLCRC